MKKRIAIVQPILSPYSIPRFEELAKDENLEIILLIEKDSLTHRPGWNVTDVKGCTVEIIDSHLRKERIENTEQRYVIEGIRAIPYKLPLLLLKYKPHIVLVCNATELFFAYLLKHVLNYKIGLIVEDTIHAVRNKSITQKRLKSILYRKADFFLPFSNDSISYLQEIKVKKPIYRTSWSIDLQKFSFSDQKKRDEIKKEFKLNDKLIFITVTQLIPRKGIINLLKAWNELLQEIQEKISLIVIGNGPQKNYIEEFVKQNKIPNMHLLGQKPYEEVIQYYHSSDIFILPTLEDLFSLVVMEAMACGLPVLTTIYNGARELIREGENGYIFDSANIQDIKKVLVKVYKNRDKLKEMGSVSLEIIKDYSHEKVMANLKEILLSL